VRTVPEIVATVSIFEPDDRRGLVLLGTREREETLPARLDRAALRDADWAAISARGDGRPSSAALSSRSSFGRDGVSLLEARLMKTLDFFSMPRVRWVPVCESKRRNSARSLRVIRQFWRIF
jgi:hypothetical protein